MMVDVDGNSLQAYSLLKSVGLVLGTAAVWWRVSIHQMNSCNGHACHA